MSGINSMPDLQGYRREARSAYDVDFCFRPLFIAMVNLMNSKKTDLTEADLPKACDYIAKQFAAHSWWPTEQPGEAKREFDLMKGSATALNVWCERWLDAGQRKKMEKELRS
ncbi:hypothetical protein [Methylobacter tundripaludum]|nr:hypothetical protein [Methylobacter tundripaludum]